MSVVSFEVIAVVAESYIVFWDVTRCKLLEIYQHSEKHVPPSSGYSSVQKTG